MGGYNQSSFFIYENKLTFNEQFKFGYEDVLFTTEMCGMAHKITVIPDVLYEWRTRTAGSTSQKSGEYVIRNRLEALLLWKRLEDKIGAKLNRSESDALKRSNECAVLMMKEINRLNLSYKDRRKMFRNAKKELLNGNNLSLRYESSLKNTAKVFCAKYNMLFTFKILQYCLYLLSKDYQGN